MEKVEDIRMRHRRETKSTTNKQQEMDETNRAIKIYWRGWMVGRTINLQPHPVALEPGLLVYSLDTHDTPSSPMASSTMVARFSRRKKLRRGEDIVWIVFLHYIDTATFTVYSFYSYCIAARPGTRHRFSSFSGSYFVYTKYLSGGTTFPLHSRSSAMQIVDKTSLSGFY